MIRLFLYVVASVHMAACIYLRVKMDEAKANHVLYPASVGSCEFLRLCCSQSAQELTDFFEGNNVDPEANDLHSLISKKSWL